MQIGYARVSTQDQDNAAQISTLSVAGCARIFEEKASASRWDRSELSRLLNQLRKGDMLWSSGSSTAYHACSRTC